jgi:Cellulase (glycosyl hydrolase family 5)
MKRVLTGIFFLTVAVACGTAQENLGLSKGVLGSQPDVTSDVASDQVAIGKPSGFQVRRAININTNDGIYRGLPLPANEIGKIKTAGFDTFRLTIDPARPVDKITGKVKAYFDPTGNFSDYGKGIVDAAITNALGAGLNVIVDIHSYEKFPGTNTKFNDAILCGNQIVVFERFLEQIARHLSKYPRSQVALELLNEPNDDGCPNLKATYTDRLRKMYNAARRGSGDMMLILSGLFNSSPFRIQDLNTFIAATPDPNTMYTIHYYGPLEFTHQGADFVAGQEHLNCFSNIPYPNRGLKDERLPELVKRVVAKARTNLNFCGKNPTLVGEALKNYFGYNNGVGYSGTDIKYVADQLKKWADSQQFPTSRLFLGEFGVQAPQTDTPAPSWRFQIDGAATADRAAWLQDVRSSFEAVGIPWAFFAYGNGTYGNLLDRDRPATNFEAWDSSITNALGMVTP